MTLPGKISWSFALVLALGPHGTAQDSSPPTDSAKTTAEWLRILRNPDGSFEDWEKARRALGPGGPRAKEAMPALIDALGDPREGANARVAEALADHGPTVVPDLLSPAR
jgi:hypothetical protein